MRRVIVATLVALGFAMLPASAAADEMNPPDVVAAFQADTLAEAKLTADAGVAELEGVDGYGPIRRVHVFTEEFVNGLEGPPLMPSEMWSATLLKGTETVGVVTFWRDEGAVKGPSFSSEPDDVRGLSVVVGTFVRSWDFQAQFDLRGDTLVALDRRALALAGAWEQPIASSQRSFVAAIKAVQTWESAHPGWVGGANVLEPTPLEPAPPSIPWRVPVTAVGMVVGLVLIRRVRFLPDGAEPG